MNTTSDRSSCDLMVKLLLNLNPFVPHPTAFGQKLLLLSGTISTWSFRTAPPPKTFEVK